MAEKSFANIHEYTVGELSGAIKRTLEDGFGFVRVRGELGRVTRAASGHMYLDLKDDKAVLSGVMWKGNVARVSINPEQGMEVVASGRISTFPGQSRYQLIIDSLEPAGVGALMALLEERKKKFAAEGLFDVDRKKPLPFLPEIIGVVTSPSGAVIRDILHRLRDRFPRHVLVWPTLVQGKGADQTIAGGIKGFNQLNQDGAIPRPDVLIVARGGGSLEDLWCFNEEAVVRAVAESEIPVISAVGHETDTTLIDYVADRRAPTPTAAAEMAVPVRTELLSDVISLSQRLLTTQGRAMDARRNEVRSAARGLGRPEDLLATPSQRVDRASDRLTAALKARSGALQTRLAAVGSKLGVPLLAASLERIRSRTAALASRLDQSQKTAFASRQQALSATRLSPVVLLRQFEERSRDHGRQSARLLRLGPGLVKAPGDRLSKAGGLLEALSYRNVLERGFALVRNGEGAVIASAQGPADGQTAMVTFKDGDRQIVFAGPAGEKAASRPKPAEKTKANSQKQGQRLDPKRSTSKKTVQTSLFDEN
ncbi:MAG: exodeoxyribonuclease VII large subunit [Pseudomonadota bacterium]